jgi:hypothetical protein
MWNWYFIINEQEFLDTGLPSKEVTSFLTGIGQKTFLVTRGNVTSITVDDVMLALGVTNDNPFVFGSRAILLNDDGDIFYGVPQA